jgi:hypothetical protein
MPHMAPEGDGWVSDRQVVNCGCNTLIALAFLVSVVLLVLILYTGGQ